MGLEMRWGWTGKTATLGDLQVCVGRGWADILERLVKDLEVLGWNGVIYQVKEKFGGLRFYVGADTEAIRERINQAEDESFKVCERCGAPGKIRNTGWILTLCDEHFKQHEEERDARFSKGGS